MVQGFRIREPWKTRGRYELMDHEWSIISPLLPNKPRGVPRVDDRRVLNGILWRFRRGAMVRPRPATTALSAGARLRAKAATRKAWANIPPKANRKGSFAFLRWVQRQRNLVERFFNRIKQFRGIATRYDKHPANYLAAVKLVAARIWCQSL